MEDKIKLFDVSGKKTPDYIVLRIKRKHLKNFPKSFFIDLTIEDIRDATPNPNKYKK